MPVLIFLIAYIISAIPFSTIIVKSTSGKNLSREGSGNVGTLNAVRISGNKLIGLYVLIFDVSKAALALLITYYLFFPSLYNISICCVGVMLGHKFNIFLHGKGGIGLAPAMGLILMLNYLPVIIWGIVWIIFYLITRNMDKSIIAACLLNGIIFIAMDNHISDMFQSFLFIGSKEFYLLVIIINTMIIISPSLYKKKILLKK